MKKIMIIFIIALFLFPMNSYSKNNQNYQQKITALEKEVNKLRAQLQVYQKHNTKAAQPLKMTVTAAVIGKQLSKSAIGKKIQPGQVAVSQDKAYLLNKWVYIPQHGKLYVACIMPKKWKNRLDIYVTSLSKAKKIGCSVKPVAVLRG